jgi:hypothetical protein
MSPDDLQSGETTSHDFLADHEPENGLLRRPERQKRSLAAILWRYDNYLDLAQ